MSQLSYVVVIMAAGASKRLGRPKQLLKYQGTTLIRRICEYALRLNPQVVVVLGADSALMVPEIEDLAIEQVYNPDWDQGMSTSLKAGLKRAREINPQIEGVLALVVDQPYLTYNHLTKLIDHAQGADYLVYTRAHDVFGVPAFIGSQYFDKLEMLSGDQGARSLFDDTQEHHLGIHFPAAAIDIDTEEDLRNYLSHGFDS